MSLHRKIVTRVEVINGVCSGTYVTRPLNEDDILDNTRFLLCEFNNSFDSKQDLRECFQYWSNTISWLYESRKPPKTIAEYGIFEKQTELLLKRIAVLQVRSQLEGNDVAPHQALIDSLELEGNDVSPHQVLIENIGTMQKNLENGVERTKT